MLQTFVVVVTLAPMLLTQKEIPILLPKVDSDTIVVTANNHLSSSSSSTSSDPSSSSGLLEGSRMVASSSSSGDSQATSSSNGGEMSVVMGGESGLVESGDDGGLMKTEIETGGQTVTSIEQQEAEEAAAAAAVADGLAIAQHSIFSPAVHPMTMYNYGGVPTAAQPGVPVESAAAGQAALFPYGAATYATDYNGQAIVNPYALSAGGIPFTYVIAANPADPASGAVAPGTAAATAAGQPVAMAPSSYPSFIVPFGGQTPLMAATGPNGTVTYYAPQPAGIQTDPTTGAIQV